MINYRVLLTLAVMGLGSQLMAEISSFSAGSTLAEALDNQGLSLVSNGPWIAQSDVTYDGQDAAFGTASFTDTAELSTTVDGPAVVRFWWKVEGSKSMSVSPSTFAAKDDALWSQGEALVLGHGADTVSWTILAGGNTQGFLDEVEVIAPVSINEALDTDLTFQSAAQVLGMVMLASFSLQMDRTSSSLMEIPTTILPGWKLSLQGQA